MTELATRRVRLVAIALVLGAVGFAATGVARLVSQGATGRPEVVTLPLALLVADLVIAGALVTGWYPIRPVAQGLAIFGALVHVLVLLGSGGWWIRGWSVPLSVAHGYALVLLFAFSAEERDEDEEPEPAPAAPDREAAPPPPAEAPVELPTVPTPVTQLATQSADPTTPADERPADEQLTDEQPTGEQPTGEQPTGEQPTGEQPTGEQPTGRQPTGGQPARGQPADERPAEEQPADEQPADAAREAERVEAVPARTGGVLRPGGASRRSGEEIDGDTEEGTA